MLYIESPYTNPYTNLALEEYCFNQLDDDVFIIWQNDKTIVVGKYQNTVSEISNMYVEQNDIAVVRRLSGGGAVYHDLGNVNFSFIQQNSDNDMGFRFEHFTKDIISLLSGLDVKAEFNSRNDLVIDGRKFSGNSQYIKKGKILHHGTLLFDSNLETLVHALNVSNKKIESKAIASVHERVTNIKPHLKTAITVGQFKEYIKDYFTQVYHIKEYSFSHAEIQKIMDIAASRYKTWEWNYGSSPASLIKKEDRSNAGQVEIYLDIQDGVLRDIKIFGDFFAFDHFEEALAEIKGKKYSPIELRDSIYKLAHTIRGMDKEWLLHLIMD